MVFKANRTGVFHAEHVQIVKRDALLSMRFRENTLSIASAVDHRPAHEKDRDLDETCHRMKEAK